MKRIVILMSVLVAMSLMSSACGAAKPANHLEAIKRAGVIKIGTSADYPPFESAPSDMRGR